MTITIIIIADNMEVSVFTFVFYRTAFTVLDDKLANASHYTGRLGIRETCVDQHL